MTISIIIITLLEATVKNCGFVIIIVIMILIISIISITTSILITSINSLTIMSIAQG